MHHSVSAWDTLGAILLLGWAGAMWAAVAVLAVANRRRVRPWVFHGAAGVIGIGLIGQVGHLQEHAAQAGYWIAHPNSKPWMTAWGDSLARGYGQIDPSKPSLGMEILHLTGNFIFLAGLAGVVLITARARKTQAHRWGKMGVWMQGIHGLEHVALTLSVALGANRAIGLSTWFGTLPVGPGLWTYRVWWHALANLVGSIVFGIAVYRLWQERATVRASFGLTDAPATPTVKEPVLAPASRPVADAAGVR
ncbi:DUF6008 family protein [Jatrophihabitans sp.]|uniref:DUF6008 family protein n=1 Tax=Jatrophihabitans sp. TaxID=1932789 RepID=UPI0038CDC8B9